jgi:non-specific serine/threonine protein kinase
MDTPRQDSTYPQLMSQSSFGTLLRRYRLAAGLSQEDLAERAGVSVQAVSLLENGKRRTPYRHTVSQLASALGLSDEEAVALETTVIRARPAEVRASPALSVELERGRATLAPDDPSPIETAGNLPRLLTSFIGRRHEVKALGAFLATMRMITLTGAGGCGKTRLAIESAFRMKGRFSGGVWFVDLAPLTDPALVVPTIAQSLGIREETQRSMVDALQVALGNQQLLLMLDNCEHLIAACASVAELLLQTCPSLTIMATSREPLQISGELAWRVPSLSLPDLEQEMSVDSALKSEAVRLFAERAGSAHPDFSLTRDNLQSVIHICRELDGMPLALELAAVRTRTLTVRELALRLDQRFLLLTGGSRTALPRHQALQATMDWSHSLLTPEEQRLFARLSVFVGGWTLDAAEAVGMSPHGEANAVVLLLGQLVEKSLVVAERIDDDTTRYRLLETIRQYAQGRLEANGERESARRLHAAYYLIHAEHVEPQLTGSTQLRWLASLERDHDNLRAAMTWWLAQADEKNRAEAAYAAECGLRLAGALFWFWFLRDHHVEAAAWLDRMLSRGGDAFGSVLAKAYFGAGVFAWSLNDLVRSEALLRKSVENSQDAQNEHARVLALAALGFTLCLSGKESEGDAIVEDSIVRARDVADPWLLGYALLHRLLRVAYGPAAECAYARDAARTAAEEASRLFETAGDALCNAEIHLCLGELAMYEADYDRAKVEFRAALPMMKAAGWRTSIADGIARLGDVARNQGDAIGAANLYREALALYRQSGRTLGANLIPHVPAILRHLEELAPQFLAPADSAWVNAEPLSLAPAMRMAGASLVPAETERRF